MPDSTPPPTWNPFSRAIVFVLASTSIACLLTEFYAPGKMRPMTLYLFLPATAALLLIALVDHLRGRGPLPRLVLIGLFSGLLAAVAYDLFRIPFVYADRWHIASIIPHLPLFKVFPQFGSLILRRSTAGPYSTTEHLIGWAYHFSNGATFGAMFVALVGFPSRKNWYWAIVFAVGLELAMLFTPYPQLFKIKVGPPFIIVTLTAHLIFGVVMGLVAWRLSAGRNHVSPARA